MYICVYVAYICVYRPPGQDLEEFNNEFGQLLDALTSKVKISLFWKTLISTY